MIALPTAMKWSQIDIGISSSSINSHLVVMPARHLHPFFLPAAPAHASLRRIQGFPVRGHTHPEPTDGSATVCEPPTSCRVQLREPEQLAARTPSSLDSSGTHCRTAGLSATGRA